MKHLHSWFEKRNAIPIPRHYRLAYVDFLRAYDVCYPIPINYIVRYWLNLYWGSLRAFYWVGVIDTKFGEEFRWDDFWRISNAR